MHKITGGAKVFAHLQKAVPIGNKKLLDRFFSDLRTAGLTE
jgi:hypothetical protein